MSEPATAAPQPGEGQTAGQAPAPATSQATAPQPTSSASAASPFPWLPGADDVTVGYLQNKGWTEPAQVVEGYRNLEKLLGADRAGNTVVIPKAGASEAEVNAFHARFGRPDSPDGYAIEVPEGIGDKEYTKAVAQEFYKLGVPKQVAEELIKWNNSYLSTQVEQMKAQAAQRFQADEKALKEEWGAAFDQNLAIARKAVQVFKLPADVIDGVSSAIGHKAAMNFFKDIGAKTLEDSFVTGGGNGNTFQSAMTPAQAKAELAELMKDKTFVSQYVNRERAATDRVQRLMNWAYPEGA